MAKHTRQDYARLLIEYLNQLGLTAVLGLDQVDRNYQWNGNFCLERRRLVNDFGHSADMNAHAHVYVDDEGGIRLAYREDIVFDLDKKARREQGETARRAEEEERRKTITQGELAEEGISSSEDDEYISERKRLKVLEELSVTNYNLRIYGRSNESAIYFSEYREMDSCSKNSAKKAAQWIYDMLLGACTEIGWLSERLGFHRCCAECECKEWFEEMLTDSFVNLEQVCLIRSKEYEMYQSVQKQKEIEEMIRGCEMDTGEEKDSQSPKRLFMNRALEGFRAQLQEERVRQEALQREIDDLMNELILL